MKNVVDRLRREAHKLAENVTQELLRSEGKAFGKLPQQHLKTKLASPEEEVKKLIATASSLNDVWAFLIQRLRSGSEPSFILFSTVDEVADLLRIKYLYPAISEKPFQGEFIPLCDKTNHLVRTVYRQDTTFASQATEMGQEVYTHLNIDITVKQNVFSIPLVAGNKSIALITLGFQELDSFSQAKLSYVYLLRDQIAQLVWNLVLQERIQNQPQLDNLTGLVTYSSFHQIFQSELKRARLEKTPLSLLLVDINGLKEYNDQYSHQMGDRAIARLATLIKRSVRGIDTTARYGNDEIAIILPETMLLEAKIAANKIITGLNTPDKSTKPFTISIGIAEFPGDNNTVETLIQIAENALQFGKHQSDHTGASSVMMATDLDNASAQDRLEVFTAQVAKKYGHTGSNLFESLLKRIEQNSQLEAENHMLETVASLAGAMDAKDKYTRGHSQSVANYAVALAHAMGLPPADVERIRLAAFFHDIGKIGIPETILNKPGPLTDAEKEIMKQHPVIGARQILQPVTALRDIVPLVEYHHERWDGLGHPEGLKGENIPMGARIISVVDAFHALTSNRPYREAMPLEQAAKVLEEGAGNLWDPTIVACFSEMLQKARGQSSGDKSALTPDIERTAI